MMIRIFMLCTLAFDWADPTTWADRYLNIFSSLPMMLGRRFSSVTEVNFTKLCTDYDFRWNAESATKRMSVLSRKKLDQVDAIK